MHQRNKQGFSFEEKGENRATNNKQKDRGSEDGIVIEFLSFSRVRVSTRVETRGIEKNLSPLSHGFSSIRKEQPEIIQVEEVGLPR